MLSVSAPTMRYFCRGFSWEECPMALLRNKKTFGCGDTASRGGAAWLKLGSGRLGVRCHAAWDPPRRAPAIGRGRSRFLPAARVQSSQSPPDRSVLRRRGPQGHDAEIFALLLVEDCHCRGRIGSGRRLALACRCRKANVRPAT